LCDDVTFVGPMATTHGADDYVEGLQRMSQRVAGLDLQKSIVEGDNVCIMYDLVADEVGPIPALDWYHFRDDKIDSVRAYFDPRPLTQQRASVMGIPQFASSLQVCADPY
jgi:hypothetical protein